jgi:hypothetical protein
MGILTQHITMDAEPVAQRAAKAGRPLPPGLADVITRCMQKNPAQRFSTMDELVNVLVQIYRSMVGPGMSTYMEAFPVLPSSAHQVQPTPPPMTGPFGIGNAQSAAIAAAGPSGAQHISASGSAIYPAPRKSKLGMILAIVAVLAVGGGVAAMVVVNGNKDPGKGSGSGSQIASNDPGSGSSKVVEVGGRDAGSATVAQNGSDHPLAGSDHPAAGSDHPAAGSDAGSNHAGSGTGSEQAGSDVESHHGSDAGSNTPPPVEVVHVPLFARNGVAFEVYENGVKLFDGPDNLEVPKGEKRTVVIKARGFKDKTIVVEGSKKKVQFSLDRLAVNNGSGSGHVLPPPGPSCATAIVDPASKACVAQYCAKHPDDSKCGLE